MLQFCINREGEDGKFVSVTVKATDNGDPSLEGVCSFTVEITDINDNPPLFDRQVGSGDKLFYCISTICHFISQLINGEIS